MYDETVYWVISSWKHNEKASWNQSLYVVFLCVINGNCEETTQSIRHGLPPPPFPCWSKCVLRVNGDEGGCYFHTQAISFGTEQWNLQMKDHFLLNLSMGAINLERGHSAEAPAACRRFIRDWLEDTILTGPTKHRPIKRSICIKAKAKHLLWLQILHI